MTMESGMSAATGLSGESLKKDIGTFYGLLQNPGVENYDLRLIYLDCGKDVTTFHLYNGMTGLCKIVLIDRNENLIALALIRNNGMEPIPFKYVVCAGLFPIRRSG